VVLRAVFSEALRGRRVRWGWPALAVVSLLMASWAAERGNGAVLGTFLFSGNFAILCAGGIPREEYRSGRATALLLGGVSRGLHHVGVGLAWTTVFLGGSFLFAGAMRAWALVSGRPPLSPAAAVGIPLGFLSLLAAAWLLGVLLPSWTNVAAVVGIGIALRMVEGYPETFGVFSSLARLVVGSSSSGSCTLAGRDAGIVLVAATARWLVLLLLGALVAETRFAARRLGRVSLEAASRS